MCERFYHCIKCKNDSFKLKPTGNNTKLDNDVEYLLICANCKQDYFIVLNYEEDKSKGGKQ